MISMISIISSFFIKIIIMKKGQKIKLIFGLGNPEEKFKNTPHNFGRDLIEFYLKPEEEGQFSIIGKYKNIYLAIGKTYMNDSGLALKEVLSLLKIKTQETLIVHDEADLPFLYIKFTFNQSSSMHKGVESIYRNCGKEIWRMRIGIQDKKRKKAEEIILKKLTKKHLLRWEEAKNKFETILEKLTSLPIEKLSLPKDFFYK